MSRSSKLIACVVLLFLVVSACRRSPRAPESTAQTAEPTVNPQPLKTSLVTIGDQLFENRLLRGFYNGTPTWRWTARQFAISLDPPPPLDQPTELILDIQVPTELIDAVQRVTVTARVNGVQVGEQRYATPGRQYPRFPIPATALKTTPAIVEVALDRWGKNAVTGRDIGLIVVSVNLTHPDSAVIGRDAAVQVARQGYDELIKRRALHMSVSQQNEMMKLFHELPVWRNTWFQNVQIEKNPLDLWMMQQIIYETQPAFVIETGTFRGGSALFWAHTLNGMGLENSRVITIDIQDLTSTPAQNPLWKKYVTFMKGSSTDPAIVAEIAKRANGKRVFITLDSDHAMNHVLNELHAYSPLVGRGDYLIVEDTHMDGVPTQPDFGPGPMAAVQKFLKEEEGAHFEQDLSREAFVMTFQPGGWLRKK